MKAFCSWSGGKDSCLACYRAMREGLEICRLLNMLSEDGSRARSHGLRAEVLMAQSEAVGIPMIQRAASWESYEGEFKRAVLALKEEGIEAGVFGDIDLIEHREWIERVCRELGVKPVLPLWGSDREEVMEELISAGFEAVVVAVRKDALGPEWLGRGIDDRFVDELRGKGIDLCGEEGEYHTLVIDGPIFSRRLVIERAEIVDRGEVTFLDITGFKLETKG